jgi:subtilase family serine protease
MYDNGNNDEVAGLSVDIAGNVYVTGRSRNGGNYDFATLKYSPSGSQIWLARYNSGGSDYPAALVADAAGNVYIAGRSFSGSPNITDLRVVKYDTDGVQQWARKYDGGIQDFAAAMAVDSADNVYVTGGRGQVNNYDYGTLKLNADGSVAWSAAYDNGGADDEPADIAVDGAGRVYVTGTTGSVLAGDRDFATVVYNAAGVEKKVLFYDAGQDDVATSIALGQDSEGLPTAHVVGAVTSSLYKNYVTIKYGTSWPDLTVSALSGPGTGLNNGDIVVNNTVLNVNDPGAGKNESAAASDVAFYLAPNVSGSPDLNNLISLGTRSVPTLTTGTSDAASSTVTIPGPATVSGSYFIVATADSGSVVTEKDETNNTTVSASTITISDGPDLVPDPSSISGPAADTAGNDITINFSVDNSHAVAAGSFDSSFVLSTDTVIGNGDDIAMPLVSGGTIASVAGNGSSPGSATVTIPTTVSGGDYYFGVIVDSGDAITEAREDNNSAASTGANIITVTELPDLTVSAVSGELGVTAGQTMVISNTVHATGDVGAFDIALYLSTDTTIDGSDISLGTRSVTSMTAGSFNTDDTVVTIPGGTAQGTYYVGAIVDSGDSVIEHDETNNTLSSSTTTNNSDGSISGGIVTVGDSSGGDDVDLVVTNVNGPGTAVRGDPITVGTTVENALSTTSGGFDVGLYLSPDPDITMGDIFLGSRTIASLAGGGSDTGDINGTIPIDLINDNVEGLWHMNAITSLTMPPNTVDNGNGTWTTTLQPDGTDGIDTYVQSFAAGATDTSNTNFGSSTQMRFNYYASYNSELLLKFDLSSLPIASLNSATLSVRTKSTDAGVSMTYRVGKITSNWNESTATWNNRPSRTGNYASANVPINAWANWSVTTLVNEWLAGTTNYGFDIYRASSTGAASGSQWYRMGYSSDYTATPSYRPKLVLTYVPYSGITDVSANSNDGVVMGGVSLNGSGQFNSAISFDGTSGVVSVAENGIALASPLTLEAWINPTDNTTTHVIIGKEDSYLMAVSGGTLQYSIMTNGSWAWVDTGLSVPTGSWSHVAITYNGTTVTGYVNGVGSAAADPDGGAVAQNSNPVCLGNRGTSCDGTNYFNGLIDEVALYNVALSSTEISDRYTSATEGAAWNHAYYLGAIADTGGAVIELNENNNAAVQVDGFGQPGSVAVRQFGTGVSTTQPRSSSGGGGAIGWMELLFWLFAIFWLNNAAGMRRTIPPVQATKDRKT